MRQIKFRGISIDTGKWVYGYLCFDSNKENAVIINKVGNNEMQHNAVIPKTVGQFTGLLDKNGKEIWEGDKVDLGHVETVVYFENGGFKFLNPYDTTQGITHFTENELPNYVVTGNIHETL